MPVQATPATRAPRSRQGSCPLRSLSCVIRSGSSGRSLNGSFLCPDIPLDRQAPRPRYRPGIHFAASTGRGAPCPQTGAEGIGHAAQPAWRDALNSSTCQTPAAVHCTSCDAVCCRLTVVLGSEDDVPSHLTTRLHGLRVMARDTEGWCVALDGERMNCRIYASRPAVCRSFVMGGPYCRAVRDEYVHPGTTPSNRQRHEEKR